MNDWVNETLYPHWGQRFEVTAKLADERSPFQSIVVVQTITHGRVLLLDGAVQVTEADEFIYHEMIAHVPLLVHGNARRVLIIGAGDGGVLRRVLQHPAIEAVVMVEIDGAVMRLARQLLPGIAGDAWFDKRATIIEGDGIQHVADAPDAAYDVIIVDSTDPVGVGEVLFTAKFYADCRRVLGPTGILVSQSGVPFMQSDELRETQRRQAASFRSASAYVIAVPTYVGGLMALGIASDRSDVAAVPTDIIRDRAQAAGILGTTRYWSPDVQTAAFQLPPYIAQELQ
jgi:spermidine synthase